MSERAPQWERDNGLPGRHALSSPVPPRSCHSSLIAQNGLLRDCCLPLRRLLPFPRRRGAAMATPAPRPAGRPGEAGAEAGSLPPALPRSRDRAEQSLPPEAAGTGEPPALLPRHPAGPTRSGEGSGAAPPGRSRLLTPCPGLKQPAGLVVWLFGFFFFPLQLMHIYGNGAEHRDGRTGAFGGDGISPEGKAGQERESPAVGPRGPPRGALPKLRARAGHPFPQQPPPPSPRSPHLVLPKTFPSTSGR